MAFTILERIAYTKGQILGLRWARGIREREEIFTTIMERIAYTQGQQAGIQEASRIWAGKKKKGKKRKK